MYVHHLLGEQVNKQEKSSDMGSIQVMHDGTWKPLEEFFDGDELPSAEDEARPAE